MDDSCTLKRSAGDLLVEAITTRDFDGLAQCLAPDATMRALLPSGAAEVAGGDEITARFRFWFGAAEGFEVLDTTVATVGSRQHVAWRARVSSTPRGATGWHVIEQQAFVDGSDAIDGIDLLCTGFLPEGATAGADQ